MHPQKHSKDPQHYRKTPSTTERPPAPQGRALSPLSHSRGLDGDASLLLVLPRVRVSHFTCFGAGDDARFTHKGVCEG